ncbi:MAG TPA: S-adenosylmethionine decarboxylase [Gemmatimonadaceae bacterium]
MKDAAPFTHVLADLIGVSSTHLRDTRLLTGLLIAAAGAAGFATIASPQVHQLPNDDVTGVLLLDECHIALHAFPERELLLLDVLTISTRDTQKALDVFTRRLAPRHLRSELHGRG